MPFVLYDLDAKRYKMWFTSVPETERDAAGEIVRMEQKVGYGESDDGLSWRFHPEAVWRKRPLMSSAQAGWHVPYVGEFDLGASGTAAARLW